MEESNLVVIVPLGPAALTVAEALRHILFPISHWETKYYRAPLRICVDAQQNPGAAITLYVHVGDSTLSIATEGFFNTRALLNFTDSPLLGGRVGSDLEEVMFGYRALADLSENWRHACEPHPLLAHEGLAEDPFRRLKTIIDTTSWLVSDPLKVARESSSEVSDHATAASQIEFDASDSEMYSLMDDISQLRSQTRTNSLSDEERRARAAKLILRLADTTGFGCE